MWRSFQGIEIDRSWCWSPLWWSPSPCVCILFVVTSCVFALWAAPLSWLATCHHQLGKGVRGWTQQLWLPPDGTALRFTTIFLSFYQDRFFSRGLFFAVCYPRLRKKNATPDQPPASCAKWIPVNGTSVNGWCEKLLCFITKKAIIFVDLADLGCSCISYDLATESRQGSNISRWFWLHMTVNFKWAERDIKDLPVISHTKMVLPKDYQKEILTAVTC